jgi:hypothetical protein
MAHARNGRRWCVQEHGITARSTRFCNSRMFPGQWQATRTFIVSDGIVSIGAKRLFNYSLSSVKYRRVLEYFGGRSALICGSFGARNRVWCSLATNTLPSNMNSPLIEALRSE